MGATLTTERLPEKLMPSTCIHQDPGHVALQSQPISTAMGTLSIQRGETF